MTPESELITVEQALELLGYRVSRGTLDNWRTEKSRVKGPDFVIQRGSVRYVRSSVERFAREYPFRKKPAAAARGRLRLAVLLVLLAPLALAGGLACKSAKAALRLPERAFVDGEKAVHDFIAPKFETYVAADPTLTEAEKASIGKVVDDWELALKIAADAVESDQ